MRGRISRSGEVAKTTRPTVDGSTFDVRVRRENLSKAIPNTK